MHYIITALGCKVNQYEAQAIETLLQPHGFTAAGEGDPVDLIVVNTCAVTAEGGRKSRQMIRKLREEHPQALCAVCGCWSQLSPEDAAAIGADVVHGSGSKQAFVDDILRAFREHTPVTCVDNPFRRFDFEPLPAGAAYGRTRAMLKIQDGCNNFCTYCVIPYTRGRIRSLPPDEMARQAAHLAEEGYRELVLTGIEIASFRARLRWPMPLRRWPPPHRKCGCASAQSSRRSSRRIFAAAPQRPVRSAAIFICRCKAAATARSRA